MRHSAFSADGNFKVFIHKGFTLIELSIVLVIIGLIVGGILTGRELIASSGINAQLTQIEKYKAAVDTFQGKYDALPGDIADPAATNFGFVTRGGYSGEGDGNGIIEGVYSNATAHNYGYTFGAGEMLMFWVDLSTAHLIEGGFTAGSPTTPPTNTFISGSQLNAYFPLAKIGNGNYVSVYSTNFPSSGFGYGAFPPTNFFQLSAILNLYANAIGSGGGGCSWCMAANPGVTVAQAYAMDKKIDDGFPTTGNVTTRFTDYQTSTSVASAPNSVSVTNTTCYDTTTYQYSYKQNSNKVNCALSFRF